MQITTNGTINWASMAGVLSVVVGVITQAVHAVGLPPAVSVVLVGIGGIVVAVERLAIALEAPKTTSVSYPKEGTK
jgi:hypothetical protein